MKRKKKKNEELMYSVLSHFGFDFVIIHAQVLPGTQIMG